MRIGFPRRCLRDRQRSPCETKIAWPAVTSAGAAEWAGGGVDVATAVVGGAVPGGSDGAGVVGDALATAAAGWLLALGAGPSVRR